MKFVIFSVKKLVIFFICFCFFVTFCVVGFEITKTSTKLPFTKTVVVDAGHGGVDGGCVGTSTGVFESDLNLQFSKVLKEQLENMNIGVKLTRSNSDGLYSESASNHKKSEMQKRKQIIEETNPDVVVSIHMNSYPLKSCRGAQVFYKKGSSGGELLANDIQLELANQIEYAKNTSKVGDFFVLNCTEIPSVLIECGFLSNAEEEKLLISQTYQQKFCYSIVCGLVKYFNEIEGRV